MYSASQITNVLTGNPITRGVSVTSADVNNNYNVLLAKIRLPDTIQALKLVEDQQDNSEEELIKYTTACDVPMLNSLRDRISGLQAAQLKEYTIKQLHNPAAMNAAMCIADSIFYTSPFDVGSLYLNNRIRLYIHDLRQIGSETTEGYAIVSDFENARDFFIIKVARSPEDDILIHELVVGLYGTNKLRQYIPNFTYVYGGFKCSPPLIDPETKKVVTWCLHDDNAVNYILYENINPSVPMSKYLETCSGKDFVNVYMQILYALRLAFKVIDYTHYDLNYDNVLIRDPFPSQASLLTTAGQSVQAHRNFQQQDLTQLDPKRNPQFQIRYQTERGVEYVTTQVIPTIIDYGNSHIKVKETVNTAGNITVRDQHYGKSGLIPFSIFPYRSWIMHDMYKFLMFCMASAIRNNNQSVLQEATKIFRFFNYTEDPVVAVNAQSAVSFSFPLTDVTNTLSINDLAAHVRMVCNCDFISPNRSTDPILDCERICLTESEILTRVGMNPNGPIGVPDNIIEFYDIAVRLQNENREAEKQQMARAFPYRQCMRNHINKMEELIRELQNERRKLKLVDVGQMTVGQLLQYNTMMIVRSTYVSVGTIVDKTVTLRFYNEIGHAVALSYQDDNAIRIMDDIMARFNRDIRPSLEDAKRILGSNHDYLNRIESDVIVQTSLQRDPRLRWYWDGRDLFDIAFGRTIWDDNRSLYIPQTKQSFVRANAQTSKLVQRSVIPTSSNIIQSPQYNQTVDVRSELVRQGTFDPDPTTQVVVTQPPPQRTTVIGPYGPGGQQVQTTGVYTPPAYRQYVTTDIQEHPVTTTNSAITRSPQTVNIPTTRWSYAPSTAKSSIPISSTITRSPQYNQIVDVKSEVVGQGTFDPDPITQVVVTQPTPQRTTVIGPYGPGGQEIQTTGVYTPPAYRQYITTDIQGHPVNVV
ncbi:Protein kinase [uncultured virus]|nr:Protein kinase [uncultured virus]